MNCEFPNFWAFHGGCCNSPFRLNSCGGDELLYTDPKECCPDPELVDQCESGEKACIDNAGKLSGLVFIYNVVYQ